MSKPSFAWLPEGMQPHFTVRDLVFIGIFAAVAKAAALGIAFVGGGMNPLSLALKNFVYTALMLVLAHKVQKPWTLTLAVLVSSLISLLLMGQGVLHTPGALLTCVLAEFIIYALGGYHRAFNLMAGVLFLEVAGKVVSLAVAWMYYREQPALIAVPVVFISIGALGSVVGLAGGTKLVKELRHASFIS
ncbi:MptD family putative ECF transporter S component [Desulfovibrio intestinalis]|uniref:Energy-coupling factor transport system substrate-specific component n=1 Tax=Desulfovibrio intestinalis TaxID=58621 RepID=A0A7W8C0X0_9BACT|nr:MptD family putative ECF transporter S component [Desulfovibrio intestinalis]MBB5142139.1 energy-coupling factor transport system substrate-specific component [Desulfovibrio intestinalis]